MSMNSAWPRFPPPTAGAAASQNTPAVVDSHQRSAGIFRRLSLSGTSTFQRVSHDYLSEYYISFIPNSISPFATLVTCPLILTSPERSLSYPQTKRTKPNCTELNQSPLPPLRYRGTLVHQQEGLLFPLETPQSLVLLVQSVRLYPPMASHQINTCLRHFHIYTSKRRNAY